MSFMHTETGSRQENAHMLTDMVCYGNDNYNYTQASSRNKNVMLYKPMRLV